VQRGGISTLIIEQSICLKFFTILINNSMISLNLSQKRALVCGSTQGIGKAIAIAFAEAGASVILAARNEAALQRTLAELPQTPNVHHSYI
jgi:shikimate 5-dehydrogenase